MNLRPPWAWRARGSMHKKYFLYKMEALTIKTFKTSKISAVDVSERHSKDFNYKSIRFTYDGGEVPPVYIRVDGNCRIFKFENKNGPFYSLVINCTGDNESFFRKLNSAIANQSCKMLKKDHTVSPENFELVKENKYGCSVFAEIYCNKSGKTKCRISKGSYKNLIEIDELIDEKLYTQSLSGLHWFKQIHKSISTRDISKRG